MDEIKPNIELDAQLCYASYLSRRAAGEDTRAAAKLFRQIAQGLGIADPLDGVRRGLWLLDQPNGYCDQVRARAQQLIAADKAQVVN